MPKERANGPYKHGRIWRVVLAPPPQDGSSRYRTFETEKAAQDYVDAFAEETDGRSIGDAIEAYLYHLSRYGHRNQPLRPSSLQRARYHLVALLQLPANDKALSCLNSGLARKLYESRTTSGVAVATHRGELAVVNAACAWWVSQGWMRRNPFEDVRPVGVRNVGKTVLKIDDARQFLVVALSERSDEGLAAALILVLGLRVSELTDRTVEDVNTEPALLNVPRGKTRAAKRLLEVPPPLGSLLIEKVKGRERNERLFKLSRYAVHYHVQRLCRVAGVPVVCPHGLRGSASTNIVENSLSRAGGVLAALNQAQAQLGHEDVALTKSTYIAPGTIESAEARAKASMLVGNSLETALAKEFPIKLTTEGDEWN